MYILALDHVAIHVKDVSKSITFYKNLLGFEELTRPKFDFNGAWFKLGSMQELHLIEGRNYSTQSGSRKSHFALRVASVRATEEFLISKDLPYIGPKMRPDGLYQLFVEDPDGYFIEFNGEV